ncbi:MAG: rod shape-determining protein RodA, rod shape determining protein RodA [Candidatus Berkelbacteria bacterium]|nr:rod shape-determining protein RodA, rod shape determining protein RodA [Candidatus Berkelbacteria bacterium]
MKLPKLKVPFGIDWSLYLIPLILSIFGILIIFSITYTSDPTVVISQIIYLILGFAVAIFLSFLDYRSLRGFSFFLYLAVLALLVFVMFFGDKTMGASRWIDLGVFRLQPSEIGKFIILLFLAKTFTETDEFRFKEILTVLTIVGIPLIFILRQPDFGTAMVIFVELLIILFFSKVKKIYLAALLGLMLVFTPVGWHFLKDYQKERIYTFINPAGDPYGSGYNVAQAKITVGSGGLLGQGIGKGTQIQLNFLPVAHTDFVFAATAEALGFIGSSAMILLLIYLSWRIIYISKLSKDLFGFYFAIGWGLTLLFQIFINVGMNLGIMPVTGIPLPFVSAGGSSMLTNMAAIGVLQSIYLRHRKISF